jgi:signal transduction histidine kinase
MKLTKLIKTDLAKAYQCAIQVSILDMKAPLRYINQYVAENVSGYGTAADEKVQSRADYRKMIIKSRQQSKGMLFKAKIITPYRPKFADETTAIFHNEIVVQIGNKKNKHSIHLNMSCVFKYQFNKWQMVLFHGSMPDAASSTEDTFHIGEAEKKLKQLEQVVAQRTAELLTKTRELEIEPSLERVRAATMGMNTPGDILNICKVFFNELQSLGFKDLRNTLINFWDDANGQLHDYDYSNFSGGNFAKLAYSSHPAFEEFQKKIRKAKDAFAKLVIEKDELKSWRQRRLSSGEYKDPRLSKISALYYYFYSTGVGALGISTFSPISKEEVEVLKKFRNVFDMAYQRYVDIQKSAAQSREAQIELGLERVRARAMAMQKSDELSELVDTVFKELTKLDFALNWCIINIIDEPSLTNMVWAANPETNKPPESYLMKFEDYPFHHSMMKGYQERKTKHVYVLEGKEKKTYDDYLFNKTEWRRVPKAAQAASRAMKRYVATFTFSNFGGLQTVGEEYLSEENLDILSRFGKVFDLTYTRFNDLQKAEAQAREAQIELALERVRARTMAMQHSDELREAVLVIYEQLQQLDFASHACNIIIIDKDTLNMQFWVSGFTQEIYPESYHIPRLRQPYHEVQIAAWQQGVKYQVFEYSGKGKIDFDKIFFTKTDFKNVPEDAKKVMIGLKSLKLSTAFFNYGALQVLGAEALSDDKAKTLQRFAKVFQQTYTRFLDLQKAEALAREAQIEAALERVRSRSLAMHQSEELGDVVITLLQRLNDLDITPDGININILKKDSKSFDTWFAAPGYTKAICLPTPYFNHPVMNDAWDAFEAKKELYHITYTKDIKDSYFTYLYSHTPFKQMPEERKKMIMAAGIYNLSVALANNTAISVHNYSDRALSEKEHEILKRFSKVFQQCYTRFLDLQKAEAQTKEAQIETALERVRSKTMAMHNSNDVGETAAVMVDELKKLGIETMRCGIGIMHEPGDMEVWTISTDENNKTDIIIGWLDMNMHPLLHGAFESWRKKNESFSYELKDDDLLNYYNAINNYPGYPIRYDTSSLPEHIHHNEFYFPEGILFAFSVEQLAEEQRKIFKRFAGVFGQTYRRYLDLQKAEAQAFQAEQDLIAIKEAKQKAEDALTELQVTQKQLIQAEKMASLGELTAGIAHEIQNPLNFVNNFSEVSTELVDEMNEEIAKGNLEDAAAIASDLKQNLEKINHHGKRAGDIVKGMLQHSRSSNNQKEPTDINALADEYLRLAYHGLRAKDKSFNATMKTDFDESIGNINIIPQDMGRVILNLITNAFYVVNEKARSAVATLPTGQAGPTAAKYEPTVFVSTKKLGDKIEVSVKDNGNGIPQKILDKIFQPFFTTKPTGQGTGLGLSLSYDIVKAHGGELKVETEEGVGSKFIISLPV